MQERRLEQHRRQHLHLRRSLLRLYNLVSRNDRGTNDEHTFCDKLSSVWREQVKSCIVARGHEFVVDQQCCFDWAFHFAEQSFSNVNKILKRKANYRSRHGVRGIDIDGNSDIVPAGGLSGGAFRSRLVGYNDFDTKRWRHFMPRCDMHPTAIDSGYMLPQVV
jgi:hypothetical protein